MKCPKCNNRFVECDMSSNILKKCKCTKCKYIWVETEEVSRSLVEKYGEINQVSKAAEEYLELLDAIKGRNEKGIMEESVDVHIMTLQLCYMYGVTPEYPSVKNAKSGVPRTTALRKMALICTQYLNNPLKHPYIDVVESLIKYQNGLLIAEELWLNESRPYLKIAEKKIRRALDA